jgi:hypothetical protein
LITLTIFGDRYRWWSPAVAMLARRLSPPPPRLSRTPSSSRYSQKRSARVLPRTWSTKFRTRTEQAKLHCPATFDSNVEPWVWKSEMNRWQTCWLASHCVTFIPNFRSVRQITAVLLRHAINVG